MSSTTDTGLWTIEKATGWPWPRMDQLRDKRTWLEITEEDYDYALGVVPPVFLNGGGFQMGEASTHDSLGRSIRATFSIYRGKFYAAEMALDQAQQAITGLHKAIRNGA